MKTYQWKTNSYAAPFVGDSDSGFIKGSSPMAVLKAVVKSYKHPCGLFSAIICECTPKNRVLARYLSADAATEEGAGCGLYERKDGRLYVNGKEPEKKPEKYEEFKVK